MTKATPLAPSPAEAAAATERLAAWVIGALTAIVIGGVALVIDVPHGGPADGSSSSSSDSRPSPGNVPREGSLGCPTVVQPFTSTHGGNRRAAGWRR